MNLTNIEEYRYRYGVPTTSEAYDWKEHMGSELCGVISQRDAQGTRIGLSWKRRVYKNATGTCSSTRAGSDRRLTGTRQWNQDRTEARGGEAIVASLRVQPRRDKALKFSCDVGLSSQASGSTTRWRVSSSVSSVANGTGSGHGYVWGRCPSDACVIDRGTNTALNVHLVCTIGTVL